MAVAENVDCDAAREVEILLAVLPLEVAALPSHRADRRTRIDGHERRDGHEGLLDFSRGFGAGAARADATRLYRRRIGI
jgi:hypothetical protein